MEEVKQFLEEIANGRNGYSLGDPWKFSKHALGVIVPILRYKSPKRSYTTLPEVKDKVTFSDTGSIQQINVKGIDTNLFIRAGTVLEGVGTQSRGVVHSIVIEPKIEVPIEVRCVHASHGIRSGSDFHYGGRAPRIIAESLYKGNQGGVWNNVSRYGSTKIIRSRKKGSTSEDEVPITVSQFALSPDLSESERQQYAQSLVRQQMERSVDGFQTLFSSSDSLPQIKKAMEKLDTKLQDILKQVPVLENQVGAIIVGVDGVEGVETFDHPDSWKAQYKEVIENYSDTIAEESKKLFTFDDSQVQIVIKDFLMDVSNAKFTNIIKQTYRIDMKGFIGECVTVDNSVIHLFLVKTENEEPEQKRMPQREIERDLRSISHHETCFPSPKDIPILRVTTTMGKRNSHTYIPESKSLSFTMKRGYKEMFNAMDTHGGATWKELENETGVSSATLSKRLKEGKAIGLIGEDIRHPNGKKIYTKRYTNY